MSLQLRRTYTTDEILADLTVLLHLGEQLVEVDDRQEPAVPARPVRHILSAFGLLAVVSIGVGVIATRGLI